MQASRAIQEKAAAVELQGRQQQMREEKARWHSMAIHPTHSSYIRTTHSAIKHRTCDMSAQMPCASQLTCMLLELLRFENVGSCSCKCGSCKTNSVT